MSISAFVRGTAHRVASAGRAVQAASKNLDAAVQKPQGTFDPATGQFMTPQQSAVQRSQAALGTGAQQWMPPAGVPGPEALDQQAAGVMSPDATAQQAQTAPVPAQTQPAQRGFVLPDLGPAPNKNDARYQGPGGPEEYAADSADYQHKQDIHDTYRKLDQMFTEMYPQRDFQKEYQEQAQMLQQQQAARPHGSGLARFALALGDYNPAVQQSGRSNLDTYNKNVEQQAQESDQGFAKRMLLRQQMHEQAAADAERKGNAKLALAEQEKAAMWAAENAKVEHLYKMSEQAQSQRASLQRAQLSKDAAMHRSDVMLEHYRRMYNLSDKAIQKFNDYRAHMLNQPQDPTKEYPDQAQQDAAMENFLEMLVQEEGHAPADHRTPPAAIRPRVGAGKAAPPGRGNPNDF